EAPMTFEGPLTYSAGQEHGVPFEGALPRNGWSMVQDDNETLRTADMRRAAHAAGWIDLRDATHGLAVAARFFWQQYPQSFQLRPDGVTYNLWAPEAAPAKVGMGAAKTHEMVWLFHGAQAPSAALLTALTGPLSPTRDAAWVAASGALRNSVAPTPP